MAQTVRMADDTPTKSPDRWFRPVDELAELHAQLRVRLCERTGDDSYAYASPIGWAALVDELDHAIAELLPDYVLKQCKEKFGSLRYYIEGAGDQRVQSLITKAEQDASTICDICSAPGALRGAERSNNERQHWLRTRCDMHADFRDSPYADDDDWE